MKESVSYESSSERASPCLAQNLNKQLAQLIVVCDFYTYNMADAEERRGGGGGVAAARAEAAAKEPRASIADG